MLLSNVCLGQQFVNGEFNANYGSWSTTKTPEWYEDAIDLTPNGGSGNGANLIQSVSFTNPGCFRITFRLGTYNDGTAPQFHTAGVRVAMQNGAVTTPLGHVTMQNTGGGFGWQIMAIGPFSVTPGNITFTFTGDNGFATTGRVMMIDDIQLAVTDCPCNCPPLPNVSYSFGPGFTRGTRVDCSTNKIINIKCQQQVNIFANANCQGDGCTQSGVNIAVAGPGVNYATGEGDNLLAFFAMQKGDYVVTTTSTCNGKSCTPCKVTFRVEECKCPPPPCCKTPMEISLKDKDIKYQYAAETRVTVPFQLNGGGKKFTQVRANVIGFDIYSDNQKCIDCFNDSKLWGSIYNATLSGFNPTYTGKNIGSNVNTREVVFTSPVAQTISTTNLDLKLFLPQAQTLTCCNVYADLYIKISYRDNECNECDTIIPVRVSLVKTKNGNPVDINLPGNPPPGVAKAKSWMTNADPCTNQCAPHCLCPEKPKKH